VHEDASAPKTSPGRLLPSARQLTNLSPTFCLPETCRRRGQDTTHPGPLPHNLFALPALRLQLRQYHRHSPFLSIPNLHLVPVLYHTILTEPITSPATHLHRSTPLPVPLAGAYHHHLDNHKNSESSITPSRGTGITKNATGTGSHTIRFLAVARQRVRKRLRSY
jgi:hypothetical protein